MMCLLATPTVLSARMTSRTRGMDVTVVGVPDGFTLSATTSDASKNFAQASAPVGASVSALMPESIISRTAA